MTAEPDILLCQIITDELEIDASRVVVYDQGFIPPKDDLIYVVVALSSSKIINASNKFSSSEDKEIKSVVVSETYNVEITSKNTDAQERRYEINTALVSNFSEQLQESEQIRIFRTNQNLDLSFIEGGSSLHRYRIPVIINSMKIKEKTISIYDRFQTTEVDYSE